MCERQILLQILHKCGETVYLKNKSTNTTNQPFVILQYYFSAMVWLDASIFI